MNRNGGNGTRDGMKEGTNQETEEKTEEHGWCGVGCCDFYRLGLVVCLLVAESNLKGVLRSRFDVHETWLGTELAYMHRYRDAVQYI